jgi:hypothetical protein
MVTSVVESSLSVCPLKIFFKSPLIRIVSILFLHKSKLIFPPASNILLCSARVALFSLS